MALPRTKDDSTVRKSLTIRKVTDRCDVAHTMRGSRGDHFSISLNKAALLKMCLLLGKAFLFFRVKRSFNFPALFWLGIAQVKSLVCLR